MPAPSDLVHETSTSTGTGNLTVSSVNGKRTFNTAFGTGGTNVFDYFISHRTAAEWEIGTGHLSAATTFVRDTVVTSSNSNNAVNFSAGTKDICNDVPASNQTRLDATQTFTGAKTFPNTGLKVLDTNASHALILKPGSDVSAERTFTITTGDASRTLTINGDTTLGGGSHSGTNTGDQTLTSAATQAEEEAGSSTTVYTSPGRQHFHPGSAKAWVLFNGTGTPAITTSYGGSSITDNAGGDWTVNWSITFSSANWANTCSTGATSGGTTCVGEVDRSAAGSSVARTATTIRVTSYAVFGGGSPTDSPAVSVAGFGDL